MGPAVRPRWDDRVLVYLTTEVLPPRHLSRDAFSGGKAGADIPSEGRKIIGLRWGPYTHASQDGGGALHPVPSFAVVKYDLTGLLLDRKSVV